MAEQSTGVASTDQVVSQPVAPVTQPVAPAAPESTAAPQGNDRAQQQFEKLLDSNQRLFEQTSGLLQANELLKQELTRRSQSNQQFAPIQQTPVAPTQQVPNTQDYYEYDPMTGDTFINQAKLDAKLKELDDVKQRATRAEEAVQNYIQTAEQREIERQNKETFALFPELDPNNQEKFDQNFHKLTRQILQDAYFNPQDYGGSPLEFKEAADLAKRQMPGTVPSVPAEAEDPKADEAAARVAQELKEQSSYSASSQPAPTRSYQSDEDLQRQLSHATRMGDDEALAIRLKHTDHVRQSSDED